MLIRTAQKNLEGEVGCSGKGGVEGNVGGKWLLSWRLDERTKSGETHDMGIGQCRGLGHRDRDDRVK